MDGGQGRGRTADLPIFSRTLVPTELPGRCPPAGVHRASRTIPEQTGAHENGVRGGVPYAFPRFWPPSSSGPGPRPFTAVARVRIPLGVLNRQVAEGERGADAQDRGVHPDLARRGGRRPAAILSGNRPGGARRPVFDATMTELEARLIGAQDAVLLGRGDVRRVVALLADVRRAAICRLHQHGQEVCRHLDSTGVAVGRHASTDRPGRRVRVAAQGSPRRRHRSSRQHQARAVADRRRARRRAAAGGRSRPGPHGAGFSRVSTGGNGWSWRMSPRPRAAPSGSATACPLDPQCSGRCRRRSLPASRPRRGRRGRLDRPAGPSARDRGGR